jgi:hypothetical protein
VNLLLRATAEPFTLPRRYRGAVAALRGNWSGQWLSARRELDRLDATPEAATASPQLR